MTQKEFISRPRVVYGEQFSLTARDARPEPKKAEARKAKPDGNAKLDGGSKAKLQKVIMMLEELLAGEAAAVEKRKEEEARDRYEKACAAAKEAYSLRNPHGKNRISLRVENEPQPARTRKKAAFDAVYCSPWERLCAEAQSAYAARNPHMNKEGI